MAVIKAGTYRFNDVLSAPSAGFEAVVPFECSGISYANIACESDGVDFFIGYADATGSNFIVPFVTANFVELVSGNLGVDLVAGWQSTDYQTITIPNDSEVSAEFYEWFTANAVEQKQISGKWRFNDYLTPISGLQESVNFTAKYSFEYQGTNSGTISCSGLSFVEGDGYAFLLRSMFNGLSDPTDQAIAESVLGVPFPFENAIYKEYMNGDDYCFTFIPQGFDFQTIDFGTTPQYVSAEFYEWFTANALKNKEISGKWKFNDALTERPGIIQSVRFNITSTPPAFGIAVTLTGYEIDTAAESEEIGFGIDSADQDLSSLGIEFPTTWWFYTGGRWETELWGDGVKTVDFGTEPQTVSAEFYHWLTANAVPVMASITHNGSTIAELFPGQTATLKCKGMKMEDDVVVEVAELPEIPEPEIPKPVMQTLEVNLTEPGIFEFTPGAGYDGIIKVVVGVDAPQLTAPNISLNGDILTIEATDENTESFAIFVDGIEVQPWRMRGCKW